MKNNFLLFIFRLAHGTEKLLRRRPSHFRRDQKQFCIRRMKSSIGSGVIFIGQDPDFSPFFPAHPAIKEKIIASEDKNSIRIPFQKPVKLFDGVLCILEEIAGGLGRPPQAGNTEFHPL